MPQSYGKIKEGDSTIIENIPIWIDSKKNPRSMLLEWYGSFTLPIEKNIKPGGPYQLILDDGRTGDIIITNVERSSSGKHVVYFKGSGLLK
ncbi:MAG: hypothetical protein IBV53_08135 [Candidatus Atribacteria bacterium]